jgi:hypothetical protein
MVNDQIGGGNANRKLQLSYAYHTTFGNNRLTVGFRLHNKVADSRNATSTLMIPLFLPERFQIQPDFRRVLPLQSGFYVGAFNEHIQITLD